jgi:hypothetical protein
MRKISTLVKNALSSGVYSGFLLVDIISQGNPLHFTTLPYDVRVGSQDYSTDNTLSFIDKPALATNTDKELYKITFADPELLYASNAHALVNAEVRVRGGLFNMGSTDIVASDGVAYSSKRPILSPDDMLIIYAGVVDKTGYHVSEDGVTFEIECASPMSSLDAVNSLYTTRNSQQQRVPAAMWALAPDTAFDNVSLGGKSQEFLWGKI